jgi:hypothetical protein
LGAVVYTNHVNCGVEGRKGVREKEAESKETVVPNVAMWNAGFRRMLFVLLNISAGEK